MRAKLQSMTGNLSQKPNFSQSLAKIGDVFDSEICTQQTGVYSQLSDLDMSRTQNNPKTLRKSGTYRDNDSFYSSPTNDTIFTDDLPLFSTKSQKTKAQSLIGTTESETNAANEYRNAMAHLGGSDALSTFSHNSIQSSRASKRPRNFTGLVTDEDYVGDDWLIDDDITEVNSTSLRFEMRPTKRTKIGSSNFQSEFNPTGGQQTAKSNSGAFTSTFLNQDTVYRKSSKYSSPKISDFYPEQEATMTIDDDAVHIDVPPDTVPRKNVPHVKKSPLSIVFAQQAPPAAQTDPWRIRIDIKGKRFQVGVPEK